MPWCLHTSVYTLVLEISARAEQSLAYWGLSTPFKDARIPPKGGRGTRARRALNTLLSQAVYTLVDFFRKVCKQCKYPYDAVNLLGSARR